MLEATRTDVSDQIAELEAIHETAMATATAELIAAQQERDNLRDEISALTSASDAAWEVAVQVYAYTTLSDRSPWAFSGMVTHNPGRLERAVRAWREKDPSDDDFDEVQAVMRILGSVWDNMRDFVMWEPDGDDFASPLERDLASRAQSLLRSRFDSNCPSRRDWSNEIVDAIEVRSGISSSAAATGSESLDVSDIRIVNAPTTWSEGAPVLNGTPIETVDFSEWSWSREPNLEFISWVEMHAWRCFSGTAPDEIFGAYRLEAWLASFEPEQNSE